MPFHSGEVGKICKAMRDKNVDGVCKVLNEHVENNNDLKGNSPLFIACAEGFYHAAKFLVEKGNMDMHEKNKNGITPFIIAQKNDNNDIVECFQKIEKDRELQKKQETLLASINKTMREINSMKNSVMEKKQEVKNLEREREEQALVLMEELTQEKLRNIQISI